MVAVCYRVKINYICIANSFNMASIKFGSFITDIRGKVGGSIIQGGRTGSQLRNLSQPIKTVSPLSSQRKANFASFTQAWSQIGATDQNLWNVFASFQTRHNKFGDPYTPTGFQMFNEFNLFNASIAGTSVLVTPPPPNSIDPISALILTADSGGPTYTIDWTDNLGLGLQDVALYAYPLCRAGAQSVHKSPKLTGLSANISTQTIDFSSWFAANYGTTSFADMRLTMALRVIIPNQGYASSLYVQSSIIL